MINGQLIYSIKLQDLSYVLSILAMLINVELSDLCLTNSSS